LSCRQRGEDASAGDDYQAGHGDRRSPEADVVDSRYVARCGREHAREQPSGHQQAADAASGGEHHALDQGLSDETEPATSEGYSERHFRLARGVSANEQVCDVEQGKREKKGDCDRQCDDGAPYVADECVVDAFDARADRCVCCRVLPRQIGGDPLDLTRGLLETRIVT
jgi:hypothetical protein